GDPDLDKKAANQWYKEWLKDGKPDAEGHKTEKSPNSDGKVFVVPVPMPFTVPIPSVFPDPLPVPVPL
ncbi:MAG: hypothetical protein WAM05_15355, partial [Candidatus Binataceae bacterium]